jgi:hypothetical protein
VCRQRHRFVYVFACIQVKFATRFRVLSLPCVSCLQGDLHRRLDEKCQEMAALEDRHVKTIDDMHKSMDEEKGKMKVAMDAANRRAAELQTDLSSAHDKLAACHATHTASRAADADAHQHALAQVCDWQPFVLFACEAFMFLLCSHYMVRNVHVMRSYCGFRSSRVSVWKWSGSSGIASVDCKTLRLPMLMNCFICKEIRNRAVHCTAWRPKRYLRVRCSGSHVKCSRHSVCL